MASRIETAIVEAAPTCRHRILCPLVEDARVTAQLSTLRTYGATLRAGLKGLKVEDREIRTYPNGEYLAHVLGHAPRDEMGQSQGGHGVECAFDSVLKGGQVTVPIQREPGCRHRSALVIDPRRATGSDLRLSVDIVVQHFVESALNVLTGDWQPEFATAIVLDPRSGEVLALANRPNFDPASDPGMLNQAVQGLYAPGSIFKPFVAAYALGLGVATPEDRIEMPVRRGFTWRRHTRPVSDLSSHGEWDGCGTTERVLGFSSNPGAAELLWRIMAAPGPDGSTVRTVEPVRDLMARLGFDNPTGIELCGDKPARYDQSQGPWNPLYPTLGFAFGQGFVISPLRLAACFAAFARDDGRIVTPTLLLGRGGPREDLPPVCVQPAHKAAIQAGLRLCVTEGTARGAFKGCKYEVSGKTGTAQIPGTSWQYAGFAGFAPADRPRVLVLVVAKVDDRIVHPTTGLRPYGGNVAGPAVRCVIERALAYQAMGRAGGSSDEEGELR